MATDGWGYMSAAAGVVDSLRRAGVKRVFAIPAVETTELFEAFLHSSVELVLVTQEQCAAHMADAHTRVTGELSACLVGPGAGLTSSLSGITGARLDSTPMIVLVASPPSPSQLVASSRLEVLDPMVGSRPLCKGVFAIEEPEEVPAVLSQAIQIARGGEPGPVLVEIPAEVQGKSGRMEGTGFKQGPRLLSDTAKHDLSKVILMIDQARNVGLYAGAGCFDATDELSELAQRLEAPVATTLTGLGVLPTIHPLVVGYGPGRAGTPLAEQVFSRCDLVVAMGCKFYEVAAGLEGTAAQTNLVHIDIEPTEALQNVQAAVAVQAPAKQAMRFLLDKLEEKTQPNVREIIRNGKSTFKAAISKRVEWVDAVDPVKFFNVLGELLGSEDRLILDSGRHAYFGIASFQVQAERTLIAPIGYRALGFSVPAAVAAAMAQPERRVVACIGDGGFLLTGSELLTARRCNVAPVIVVFAETPLNTDFSFSSRLIERKTQVDLMPVNYEQMAKAFDVGFIQIMRDSELEAGLKTALTMEAPVIVEMRVAYREADPYLKGAKRKTWQRLTRPLALRLGAQFIMHRILED
ncbi:MAG: thiamine pyrophosphate-binding protein [Deltaproteobacteria bacterium]|nr:thiamine pyrophosphate-binding protein [Deltaproteobacteria bacterium]